MNKSNRLFSVELNLSNSNKAFLLVFGDEACIDNGLSDSSINVFDKTVQQYCLKID